MRKIILIFLTFLIIINFFSYKIIAQEKNTLITFSIERLFPYHFLGYAISTCNIGEIPLIFDARYIISDYVTLVGGLTIAIPAMYDSKFDLRATFGIILHNEKFFGKFKGLYGAIYPLYEYDLFNLFNKPVISTNWCFTEDIGYYLKISDSIVIDFCIGTTGFNIQRIFTEGFENGHWGGWIHYDIKIGIKI